MLTRALIALVLLALSLGQLRAITIDTVPVGNPGNLGDPNGHSYGAVDYTYAIGKTEVTVGQYTAFLNAVAATDTYDLYNPAMGTDLNISRIAGVARREASAIARSTRPTPR